MRVEDRGDIEESNRLFDEVEGQSYHHLQRLVEMPSQIEVFHEVLYDVSMESMHIPITVIQLSNGGCISFI